MCLVKYLPFTLSVGSPVEIYKSFSSQPSTITQFRVNECQRQQQTQSSGHSSTDLENFYRAYMESVHIVISGFAQIDHRFSFFFVTVVESFLLNGFSLGPRTSNQLNPPLPTDLGICVTSERIIEFRLHLLFSRQIKPVRKRSDAKSLKIEFLWQVFF